MADLDGEGGGALNTAQLVSDSESLPCVTPENGGVVDALVRFLLFALVPLLVGDASELELPSLMRSGVSAPQLPLLTDLVLVPVVFAEEQAWSSACSPRRLSDDAEGTRCIPSTPGLGPPNSPAPVSFLPFLTLFIVMFGLVIPVVLCEQGLGSTPHAVALQPLDNDPAETCSVVSAVPGLGVPPGPVIFFSFLLSSMVFFCLRHCRKWLTLLPLLAARGRRPARFRSFRLFGVK